MTNIEEYLRQNVERGVIDHAIRAEVDTDVNVNFYIHPVNVDGDTVDFTVRKHYVWPNQRVTLAEAEVQAENVAWSEEGF